MIKTLIAAAALAFAPLALAQKAEVARQDAQAMKQMAEIHLAEIQAGKLAQDKAKQQDVKDFGQHMVEDHSQLLAELKKLAEQKNVQLPQQTDAKHRKVMQKLQSTPADRFDRVFMAEMVKGHQSALKSAKGAAKNAKAEDLKSLAQRQAEGIEEHLQLAKKLEGGKASAGK